MPLVDLFLNDARQLLDAPLHCGKSLAPEGEQELALVDGVVLVDSTDNYFRMPFVVMTLQMLKRLTEDLIG